MGKNIDNDGNFNEMRMMSMMMMMMVVIDVVMMKMMMCYSMMIILVMRMNSTAIKNENNKCKQNSSSHLGLPVHADDDNSDQKNAGGGPNDAYVVQGVPSDHCPVLLYK